MIGRVIPKILKSETPNIFRLDWRGVDNLIINFNPLLEAYNLNNHQNFVLVHYQARPKIHRTWGLYYHGDYFALDKIIITTSECLTLEIDESRLLSPPHAVLCFENVIFTHQVVNNEYIGYVNKLS